MTADRQARAKVTREVSVPAGSVWFQGHFPGDPLLPGVAQLHLVLETLRAALEADIRLTGLKRVRFKRVIRPAEPIAIAVAPVEDKPGLYRFHLTVEGETACSGLMTTAAAGTARS
jgi:3-hydroxymyristoyl/3-hydroxydecanoyl-(acyl carrier protein) dehydratase